MAGSETDPQNPTEPGTDTRPASSAAPLIAGIISSFALVLVAMMLATGVAQRAALPRLKALVARFDTRSSRSSDEAAAPAARADGAEGAADARSSPWTPEGDSLAIVREQIAIAMAELEASRETTVGEATPTGENDAAPQAALADSAASRDLIRLVKVLDAMKPDAAARVLNSVDDVLAIEAIRRLRERQAGRVLALLSAEKAATVSLALGRGAERVR